MTETQDISRIDIIKETFIAASAEDVFASILEQLGPGFDMPDQNPMPLTLEARPGGRWYRDLGNNAGHFWGHVQVIKPPVLLEICGPMFMSFPVASHLSYRVQPEADGCRLTMTHRAFGDIPAEVQAGVVGGWDHLSTRIAERAIARR